VFKTLTRAAAIAAVLALTGCAFSSEKIDVRYTPSSNPTAIPGAPDIGVKVQISDVRTRTDRVASRTNGYGQELGAISLNQDVSALIESAIETELRNRGYKLDAGTVLVNVEIHDFYNRFQTGFWSGTATSSVRLNVKIKDAQSNLVFSERVAGHGSREKVQMMAGKNAQPALEEALKNAITALFNREDLYQAIKRANSSGG
jgi:uncharacterized lipoprotein YajG